MADDPIKYALSYLDYTIRTNQTNEMRLTRLLIAAIGGLGANVTLLDTVLDTKYKSQYIDIIHLYIHHTVHRKTILFVFLIISAMLFLYIIGKLIWGIAPRTIDSGSLYCVNHVASYGNGRRYIDTVAEHKEHDALETILKENHAMARVVISREACYHQSAFCACATGMLLSGSYVVHLMGIW